MQIIFRGINNLEELNRVERKKAEQEKRRRLAEILPKISLELFFPDFNFVWDSIFPINLLNFLLLDKINIFAQYSVNTSFFWYFYFILHINRFFVNSSNNIISNPGWPLIFGNNKWYFFKSSFFLANLFANPTFNNIGGTVFGNFGNN